VPLALGVDQDLTASQTLCLYRNFRLSAIPIPMNLMRSGELGLVAKDDSSGLSLWFMLIYSKDGD
jgi:hypothetical protein